MVHIAALVALVAHASPVVTQDPDGFVRAEVVVHAPRTEVEALLGDVLALDRLSTSISATRTSPDGAGCERVEREIGTLLGTLRVRTRRCGSDGQVREWMESSPDFSRFEATWSAEVVDPLSTRVVYRSRSESRLWIPQALINRSTRKAAAALLDRVATTLTAAER